MELIILFAGHFYQFDKEATTAIQDDFDTFDALEENSDFVQMFEDEEVQDENSERSKKRRGIWLSEDKVLLGKRLLVSFVCFLHTL